MSQDHHSQHSTLRERIVEHIFLGEVLRTFWRNDIVNLEILKSEFDAHGYDVVLGMAAIVRHIQLRTKLQRIGRAKVKPARVPISTQLATKPSGCVIWIVVSPTLELGPYFWFGAAPGTPLPDLSEFRAPKRLGRRAGGERPMRINHKVIPGSAFEKIDSLDELLIRLFGQTK
jgi:hypothetical protein